MTDNSKENFLVSYIVNIFLFSLTLLLIISLGISLRWPMQRNAAIFRYLALLMERYNYMPYRDIFDLNLPGVYFLYWLNIKIGGSSNLAGRVFDLSWLMALMIVTYFLMKDFSRRVAYTAAVLTGLIYLAGGPDWSLDRDFILLLPIALAIWLHNYQKITKEWWRHLLIGFFIGAATVIKLPAALALLAFLPNYQKKNNFKIWSKAGWLTLGFIILPAICLLWISLNGAFRYFWEITTNYLPLYGELSGELTINLGFSKILYLLDQLYNLYPIGILFGPAALGAYVFLKKDDSLSRQVYLLLLLFLLFIAYVIVQGKYWPSHWLLAEYIVILLLSLCFSSAIKQSGFVYSLTILVILLYLYPLKNTLVSTINLPYEGDDEIGYYLKTHSQPDDKVQSIGWMGQAVFGLAKAKSQLATPYLYTIMFYHHISSPYIQKLQRDFIYRLQKSPPRFIVQGFAEAGPKGEDTSQEFPLFDNFLQDNYIPVKLGQTYTIWQRD